MYQVTLVFLITCYFKACDSDACGGQSSYVVQVCLKRQIALVKAESPQHAKNKRYDLKCNTPPFAVGDRVSLLRYPSDSTARASWSRRLPAGTGVYRPNSLTGTPLKVYWPIRAIWCISEDVAPLPPRNRTIEKSRIVWPSRVLRQRQSRSTSLRLRHRRRRRRPPIHHGFSSWTSAFQTNGCSSQTRRCVQQTRSAPHGPFWVALLMVMSQSTSGFDAVTCDCIMILHSKGRCITTAALGNALWYVYGHTDRWLHTWRLSDDRVDDDGVPHFTVIRSIPQPNAVEYGVFVPLMQWH